MHHQCISSRAPVRMCMLVLDIVLVPQEKVLMPCRTVLVPQEKVLTP